MQKYFRSPVTNILIAMNLVYFAYEFLVLGVPLFSGAVSGQGYITVGAISGFQLFHDPISLLTAMFAHASTAHLLGHLLALFFSGKLLEPFIGGGRLAVIYFAGGVIGNLGAALLNPNNASLGASGAIFALFGAIMVYAIRNRFKIGSGIVFLNYGVLIVVNLYTTFTSVGISAPAHVLGLLTGIFLAVLMD
jgi:rhomboid protease GluP